MERLRVGCVTQYEDIISLKNLVRDNDIDLLVFPEHIQVLGIGCLPEEETSIIEFEMSLAKRINCAMIVGIKDSNTVFNVFVNPKAKENETPSHVYIKHTMTSHSAFEWDNYEQLCKKMFQPILFHGWRIGMTICYDSTFPVFSRLYGKQGVDLLVNSTGYDAKKDKWFKYHKVRSIENNCNSIVTMLWDEYSRNPPTYCFNRAGGVINPQNCIDDYVVLYEIEKDKGLPEIDEYTKKQNESVNKNIDLKIPVGNVWKLIEKSDFVDKNVYCYSHKNRNVIFCVINGKEILKPEKVLQLLYNKNLDSIENKSFVIVNQFEHFSYIFFQTQLETVLKVRAMENYCVVIMESDSFSKCYQCTNYKTSQVVKPTHDFFGVDLRRANGPKRTGMHNSEKWNLNVELLVNMISKM